MKKQLLIVSILLVFVVTACGGAPDAVELPVDNAVAEDSMNEPHNEMADEAADEPMADESAEGEDAMAEADTAAEAEANVELPPIPQVTFQGDEWFTPTPPDQLALASGQVQVFDFSAIWCTYCRQMAPTVKGLEQLYGEQANFVMIDIDRDGAGEYGPFIDALEYDPRFRPGIYILAPDGSVLARWLGPVAGQLIQAELVAALDTYQ